MSFYRLETVPLSRRGKDGLSKTAIAKAAYRCGIALQDQNGIVRDYSKKLVEAAWTDPVRPDGAKRSWAIVLPDGCKPEKPFDPQSLWSMADAAEKRKDARFAREFIISLPAELDQAGRVAAIREFSEYLSKEYGIACMICLHEPKKLTGMEKRKRDKRGDSRNFHAHIMVTTRKMNTDGSLGTKSDLELEDKILRKSGKPATSEQITSLREIWAGIETRALQKMGIERPHVDFKKKHVIDESKNSGHPLWSAYALKRDAYINARRMEVKTFLVEHRQNNRAYWLKILDSAKGKKTEIRTKNWLNRQGERNLAYARIEYETSLAKKVLRKFADAERSAWFKEHPAKKFPMFKEWLREHHVTQETTEPQRQTENITTSLDASAKLNMTPGNGLELRLSGVSVEYLARGEVLFVREPRKMRLVRDSRESVKEMLEISQERWPMGFSVQGSAKFLDQCVSAAIENRGLKIVAPPEVVEKIQQECAAVDTKLSEWRGVNFHSQRHSAQVAPKTQQLVQELQPEPVKPARYTGR
jgi:hypothetical protein